MPRTPLVFILLSLLPLLQTTVADVCKACGDYATDLSACSGDFDVAVASGKGPITGVAVGCMCTTGFGLNNMLNCLACNSLASFDLQLLETWILMCNTVRVSGQPAAVTCWNSDEGQCVPVKDAPLPSFFPQSTTSQAPASTSTANTAGTASLLTAAQGSTSSTPSSTSSPTSSNVPSHTNSAMAIRFPCGETMTMALITPALASIGPLLVAKYLRRGFENGPWR